MRVLGMGLFLTLCLLIASIWIDISALLILTPLLVALGILGVIVLVLLLIVVVCGEEILDDIKRRGRFK